MHGQTDEPRRPFVLAEGTRPEDAARVCREALSVLRPALHTASLDAYSDEPWPSDVAGSYELAVALGEAAAPERFRRDPRMGIAIDVHDDIQFGVLRELAPYTIYAECQRGERVLLSAADTGTSLWFALTEAEHGRLLARLDGLGIPQAVTAAPPGRRSRWRWPASWGFRPRP
ncbi:hypothetical protein AB0E74_22460 [Streptomyces sp. NPDC030392]|uniref:hypothetical protein n=1 Tax=Streptomyces sp. NPDC030392 TaxID=3155468 RepID=UPI0033CD0E8E